MEKQKQQPNTLLLTPKMPFHLAHNSIKLGNAIFRGRKIFVSDLRSMFRKDEKYLKSFGQKALREKTTYEMGFEVAACIYLIQDGYLW
jgi:hypothetical protein